MQDKAICPVCFHHCALSEGKTGRCRARGNRDGKIVSLSYGRVTSVALDPVEKKPFNRWQSGKFILSVGTFGCNLSCAFCQNAAISQVGAEAETDLLPPERLAEIAGELVARGNIGAAFTYNEPLIGYEYILDTAKLVKEMGLKTVLVTNGTATLAVFEKLAPYVDAMNIDLKGFTDRYYRDVLKGNRKMVMDFIEAAVQACHVELTTLIIPGENDSAAEMEEMCTWIAGLKDKDGKVVGRSVPLHISRFFPRFKMTDRSATDVSTIYQLAETARKQLDYVYTGNC